MSPARRSRSGARAGIGYLSADRAHEGLCLHASISDNVLAGRHRDAPFARHGVLHPSVVRAHVAKVLALFSVVHGAAADPVGSLSGGNQQRVAIARELDRAPRLLVAAQPTRGVDIAGTAFIHARILAYRDAGGAVLLVSEELDELLALADRILVLHRGVLGGAVEGCARRPRAHRADDAGRRGMTELSAASLQPAPRIDAAALLAGAAPFVVALLVGAVLLLVTGRDPLGVYWLLAAEGFGGVDQIAATLSAATPVLFCAVATAISFRAGVFNMGVEGGFYLGGLAGTRGRVFRSPDLPGPALIVRRTRRRRAGGRVVADRCRDCCARGWRWTRWSAR